MSDIPVYFYLPPSYFPPFRTLRSAEEMAQFPAFLASSAWCWISRTHYHLDVAGFQHELVDQMPDEGVIVTAACYMPLMYRPGPRQYIIDCVADSVPRFFSQCHIFQSRSQTGTFGQKNPGGLLLTDMPHWTQPGLLPRDPARGDRFENIVYFGASGQLEPILKSERFQSQMAELGLQLRFNFEYFHDYRTTDAVLAVRRFGDEPVDHKPASKLLNAWRAGVPAILGSENAFRELRESPVDYLEVTSADDIIDACRRLASNAGLRRQMAERGVRRAAVYSDQNLTNRWIEFLSGPVPESARSWFDRSDGDRQLFYIRRARQRVGHSLWRRLTRTLHRAA